MQDLDLQMGGLIYTANLGGYDVPRPLLHKEDGINYQMLTDGPGAAGWEVIQPIDYTDPKKAKLHARSIKVNAPNLWPGYDWYLWLDATMQIKKPLKPLIRKLLASKFDFAAFRHNEWNCSYTEIDKCIERKKDLPSNLERARELLRSEKMPRGFGQAATGVLFRKNTELVHSHALAWWLDMKETTMRDQCTFMLNLFNQGTYLEPIPGLHTHNEWFQYHRGHIG